MTKTLILMRHAKSSWENPALADHDRPLNTRGKKAAKALGDWLRDHGHLPDEALCSSASRTRETFEGLGLDVDPIYEKGLYHASAERMLRALAGAKGDTVLLVGHNPGIADFAERILSEPPDHPRFFDFPTGATLVAGFDIDTWASVAWRSGDVIDFAIPRELVT